MLHNARLAINPQILKIAEKYASSSDESLAEVWKKLVYMSTLLHDPNVHNISTTI